VRTSRTTRDDLWKRTTQDERRETKVDFLYSINGHSKDEERCPRTHQQNLRATCTAACKRGIIVESYAELTSRMLAFAVSFKSATDEAARLDEGDDGVHAKYLKETLATAD
jgi:hypothetical protein